MVHFQKVIVGLKATLYLSVKNGIVISVNQVSSCFFNQVSSCFFNLNDLPQRLSNCWNFFSINFFPRSLRPVATEVEIGFLCGLINIQQVSFLPKLCAHNYCQMKFQIEKVADVSAFKIDKMLVLSIPYIIRYNIQSCETGSGHEQKKSQVSDLLFWFPLYSTTRMALKQGDWTLLSLKALPNFTW